MNTLQKFPEIQRKSKIPGAHAGFTLLEVLLAIAIFAVVNVTIGTAVNGSLRMFQEASNQKTKWHQAETAWQRLSEDLASAVYSTDIPFIGTQNEINGERADELNFASTAHLNFEPGSKNGGLTRLSYKIVADENNPEELRLIRFDKKYLPENELEDEPGFVLCQNLKSFSLSYIDSNGEENDTWNSQNTGTEDNQSIIPKAVQMELVFWQDSTHTNSVSFTSAVAIVAENPDENEE